MPGITQYQNQVTEIQNKWKDYAKTLPEERREKCINAVNLIAGDLLYKISILYDANYGEEALQKTLSRWTHKFDVVADSFCRAKETYVEERGSLRKTMSGVDAALQNTSLKSASFTKTSSSGLSFSERALNIAEETELPDPLNAYQMLDPDTIVFDCSKKGCKETGDLNQVSATINDKILENDFTVCDPFDKRATKSGYRKVPAVAVGRTDDQVCNEIRKQNEREKLIKLFFPEAYLSL